MTTLFAALNMLTGQVLSMTEGLASGHQLHRHQEWLRFLKMIDRQTPKHKELHLIVDNYATHKHPEVKAWLAKLCGFPGKLGMDGSKVWQAFQDGEIVAIRNYCETDVVNTYLMFLRFQLMRGHATREQYDKEIKLVRDTLSAQEGAHWREYLGAWT